MIQRGLYPPLKRAALPKITFHGLRHSFASVALAAGEKLKRISDDLGHANTAITQAIYWHSLPDAKTTNALSAKPHG